MQFFYTNITMQLFFNKIGLVFTGTKNEEYRPLVKLKARYKKTYDLKQTSENEKKRPRPPAPLNPEFTWRKFSKKIPLKYQINVQLCHLITYQGIAGVAIWWNWDSFIQLGSRRMMALGVRIFVKHFILDAELHVCLGWLWSHLQ